MSFASSRCHDRHARFRLPAVGQSDARRRGGGRGLAARQPSRDGRPGICWNCRPPRSPLFQASEPSKPERPLDHHHTHRTTLPTHPLLSVDMAATARGKKVTLTSSIVLPPAPPVPSRPGLLPVTPGSILPLPPPAPSPPNPPTSSLAMSFAAGDAGKGAGLFKVGPFFP